MVLLALLLLLRVLILVTFLFLLRRHRGWVLTLVSFGLAPVFSFNSPFFVSPPRHVDGTRGGFDGGLSCHVDFFVSTPSAILAVRGRFFDG